MKQGCLIIGLGLGAMTINANAQQCNLSITGTVPEGINLDKLVVSTYNKELPVTSRDFSLCASKQDLQVVGRHSPRNTIYLMDKSGAIPRGIYTAEVFVQSKAINLGATSTLTKQACDLRCGYYASQRIQASHGLQQLAAQYRQVPATDSKAIAAFYAKHKTALTDLYFDGITPKTMAPIDSSALPFSTKPM